MAPRFTPTSSSRHLSFMFLLLSLGQWAMAAPYPGALPSARLNLVPPAPTSPSFDVIRPPVPTHGPLAAPRVARGAQPRRQLHAPSKASKSAIPTTPSPS